MTLNSRHGMNKQLPKAMSLRPESDWMSINRRTRIVNFTNTLGACRHVIDKSEKQVQAQVLRVQWVVLKGIGIVVRVYALISNQ